MVSIALALTKLNLLGSREGPVVVTRFGICTEAELPMDDGVARNANKTGW
jgi:hypothetical protein